MKKVLIISILVILIQQSNSATIYNKHILIKKIQKIKEKEKKLLKLQLNKEKFNETVEFIKSHEGFRSKIYKDTKGYKTIGYGFIIAYLKPSERVFLTKKQSDLIIRRKLHDNIRDAKKKYPNLTYLQLLAVAHLAYGKGFGTIRQHKLHEQLKLGKIKTKDWILFGINEIKYPKYKTNRIYEFTLFIL